MLIHSIKEWILKERFLERHKLIIYSFKNNQMRIPILRDCNARHFLVIDTYNWIPPRLLLFSSFSLHPSRARSIHDNELTTTAIERIYVCGITFIRFVFLDWNMRFILQDHSSLCRKRKIFYSVHIYHDLI